MANMKKKEKSSIVFNYSTGVLVLPSDVADYVDKAKKFDLKVLLLMSSSEKYREGKFVLEITKALGCEEKDVEASIAFWRGTGIISVCGETQENKKELKPEPEVVENTPKRAKISELPLYTSTELNALLKKHQNVIGLIDECQNILGKIFTASEIKVLMALVDYLGLDNDYILVLMHHCARKEIKSMRYIEKMAVSCLDEGFTEAAVLQEALCAKEEKMELEGKIRGVFGIGGRKLTTKEKKQVETWIGEYKYDLDVIEKAYEITVNATSKPSVHYANAILEKWYSEGVRNMDGVNELLAKRELERGNDGSSFDVDEFFQAALDRSYEKM